jgi:hypothetical protein
MSSAATTVEREIGEGSGGVISPTTPREKTVTNAPPKRGQNGYIT